MSLVKKNNNAYYENIVDKFLSGACKAIFINYLTGESIASYKDYIVFLHEYLLFYMSGNKKIYDKFVDSDNPSQDYEEIRDRVHNFVDRYIVNEDNEFGDFALNEYIAQSIKDYKKA